MAENLRIYFSPSHLKCPTAKVKMRERRGEKNKKNLSGEEKSEVALVSRPQLAMEPFVVHKKLAKCVFLLLPSQR